MAEVGRDFWKSFGPKLLIQQGHLGDTAQDNVPSQPKWSVKLKHLFPHVRIEPIVSLHGQ